MCWLKRHEPLLGELNVSTLIPMRRNCRASEFKRKGLCASKRHVSFNDVPCTDELAVPNPENEAFLFPRLIVSVAALLRRLVPAVEASQKPGRRSRRIVVRSTLTLLRVNRPGWSVALLNCNSNLPIVPRQGGRHQRLLRRCASFVLVIFGKLYSQESARLCCRDQGFLSSGAAVTVTRCCQEAPGPKPCHSTRDKLEAV